MLVCDLNAKLPCAGFGPDPPPFDGLRGKPCPSGWGQERAMRSMSRKVKFSRNWKKAKARLLRIHTCIAKVRKDFMHKTTTTISQNHALVCLENLQVRNMSKSSRGCTEQPGKKVSQKSGLNRSIIDQGWGEFRRQLEYKVSWCGVTLLAVAPHHTSQTCPSCGHENHADVVSEINVLERG